MIRLVNRITDERNYWRAKCEALHSNQPFIESERYETKGRRQSSHKKIRS